MLWYTTPGPSLQFCTRFVVAYTLCNGAPNLQCCYASILQCHTGFTVFWSTKSLQMCQRLQKCVVWYDMGKTESTHKTAASSTQGFAALTVATLNHRSNKTTRANVHHFNECHHVMYTNLHLISHTANSKTCNPPVKYILLETFVM